MRIWLDVITPKQARLMTAIASFLNLDYLITVKGLKESVSLLKRLGARHEVVGRYATGGLKDKLLSYAERVKSLLDTVADFDPDVLISFSSPEAVRVAFGLSIRAITMNDTPHSYHVARLTFPLSWRVIHPEAIPESDMLKLGASKDSLVSYAGVDEIAWVRDYALSAPRVNREFKVFIRPEESGASYLLGKNTSIALKLVKTVLNMGAEVIVKPRYESQVRELTNMRAFEEGRLAILRDAVDTLDLFNRISLVITGGGTMAREAALLGTPSISVFPLNVKLHVNEYLRERGFPIWRARRLEDAERLVTDILKDPNSHVVDTRDMLLDLEDPREVVSSVLGEING